MDEVDKKRKKKKIPIREPEKRKPPMKDPKKRKRTIDDPDKDKYPKKKDPPPDKTAVFDSDE